MNENDLKKILNTLRDLTAFISDLAQDGEKETALKNKRRFYLSEDDELRRERKRRLAELEVFFNSYGNNLPSKPADVGHNVDLQLNNDKQKTINSLQGEKEELIKLKYGEGSIGIRTRVRKKDGSIYKIYAGTYYNELGQHKTVYAKTQKECLTKLREANPKKKNVMRRQHYVTLKDWLLEWFNMFKRNKVRANTVRNYENLMKVHIIPALGKLKLQELTGERIQKFVNSLTLGNTRKKSFELLKACLDKAVILRKIPFNNCLAVELPSYKKKKRRPFTYDEQESILNSANDTQRQIFYFLCCTGLRIGEFLALTKDDFVMDEHYFIVNKAVTEEGECKTDAGNRIVYFTDELLQNFDFELLGKYKYAGLRTIFRRFFDKLGLKDVSLHCTRHTFATICHSLNMNDKTLQTLLGHSTIQMTQDVYTHIIKKGSSKIRSYLLGFYEYMCTII